MNPSRRNFLSILAAGLTLDPERLLWVPGKKLISIPKIAAPKLESQTPEKYMVRHLLNRSLQRRREEEAPMPFMLEPCDLSKQMLPGIDRRIEDYGKRLFDLRSGKTPVRFAIRQP